MTNPILLITRPKRGAERFIARLDPVLLTKVDVVLSPLLEIVPTQNPVDLDAATAVVFTSANAVSFCPQGQGQGRIAYCVGEQTAEAAIAHGWRSAFAARDADDLVARLTADAPGSRLVHLAGKHRRGEIAARLTANGVQTDVVEVYDQVLLPLTTEAQAALASETRVLLPLFSPRTAGHFAAELQSVQNLQIVAISAAVVEALGENAPEDVIIAKAPTGKDMVHCIEKQLRTFSLA
ncbi:uroporphyrinogen-III synthase [Sulfitobacter mediterraneus]|nr:uroporphyrinogen-III synthase [Sulfitobacter mediterraneus]